jgi:hypothetical protein
VILTVSLKRYDQGRFLSGEIDVVPVGNIEVLARVGFESKRLICRKQILNQGAVHE